MNKKLVIKSDSSVLKKSKYCGLSLDGKSVGDLIDGYLPTNLDDYEQYPVKFKIEIEFIGTGGLQVQAQGYTLPAVVDKEEDNE
ncbi:hypothetical protein phiCTP1_gp64 [Clostridium phage phiCTP1]|uniref:hypothetical protein n=1 Tax=Clostridium phage phiCTP1 TaxID=871584 RepID=UPI0001E07851|nr:hypothetical protein phiCTP1_gp64 [Clostridium phage phiCTP1]ADL40365.1 hypothetical phage protein [Clostridium phage phiCTP1]